MFSGGARLWQTGGRRIRMKYRTITLAPGRVAPGMALAGNVVDKDGNALLTTGTVLDTGTLDRLSRRGIEAIEVLLLDTRDAETIAQEVERAEARVALIFRGAGSPARTQLQASMLRYRQESTK